MKRNEPHAGPVVKRASFLESTHQGPPLCSSLSAGQVPASPGRRGDKHTAWLLACLSSLLFHGLFLFSFLHRCLARKHPEERCNASAGHGQMMDVETSYSDFINCDRTGRRNAVPDLTGEGKAEASASDVAKDLAEMELKDAGEPQASPAPEAEGSTSQDAQGGGGPS
ncbi:cAMP-dependent protein kinase inhibitor gamma isoform X1 [Vanacampus margaritifer]